VHLTSRFDRKHYFYADLPLGYQITQQDACLATRGALTVAVPKTRENAARFDVYERTIRVARVQLEQDSGKSLHEFDPRYSMIDLNRAGCALVEIVSEPDIRSADEAGAYVRKIQQLLRRVGACDGNMEEGSLRCDVNISVRERGAGGGGGGGGGGADGVESSFSGDVTTMGERVEVKNLNSVRSVVRAVDYEAARQIEAAEAGNPQLVHETRTFDVSTGCTTRMRAKESAPDYRFLPDPDLPPLVLEQAFVDAIAAALPELPDEVRERLMVDYGLSLYDAEVLVDEPCAAEYFDAVLVELLAGTGADVGGGGAGGEGTKKKENGKTLAKQALNWVTNELLGRMRVVGLTFAELSKGTHAAFGNALGPVEIAALVQAVQDRKISGKIGKAALDAVFEGQGGGDSDRRGEEEEVVAVSVETPMEIVERNGWMVINDSGEVHKLCRAVVDDPAFATQLEQFRSGEKPKLRGFFIGQVMKRSKGQADPQEVGKALGELL
jgi:aspartyl-tRNA(Asn)/glutamyl-tRNA(Gln) amidotransferase subunit B